MADALIAFVLVALPIGLAAAVACSAHQEQRFIRDFCDEGET